MTRVHDFNTNSEKNPEKHGRKTKYNNNIKGAFNKIHYFWGL